MRKNKKEPLSDQQKAEILLRAEKYRRRFTPDGRPFHAIAHIERELPYFYPGYDYDYVDKIVDEQGIENDAQVTFDNGILLEITDETAIQARNTLRPGANFEPHKIDGSATFTICHEIGHIVLHSAKILAKIKRATKADQTLAVSLARGVPGSGTSFRTNPREEAEANVFAGGLQVPISMIFPETTAFSLQLRYRVSLSVALRLIGQRRELDEILQELQKG